MTTNDQTQLEDLLAAYEKALLWLFEVGVAERSDGGEGPPYYDGGCGCCVSYQIPPADVAAVLDGLLL